MCCNSKPANPNSPMSTTHRKSPFKHREPLFKDFPTQAECLTELSCKTDATPLLFRFPSVSFLARLFQNGGLYGAAASRSRCKPACCAAMTAFTICGRRSCELLRGKRDATHAVIQYAGLRAKGLGKVIHRLAPVLAHATSQHTGIAQDPQLFAHSINWAAKCAGDIRRRKPPTIGQHHQNLPAQPIAKRGKHHHRIEVCHQLDGNGSNRNRLRFDLCSLRSVAHGHINSSTGAKLHIRGSVYTKLCLSSLPRALA